ncbi:MAG: hypothetical protein KDA51_04940 [Planctomycetales bacterium]|nr:hypothetical protein [Planctomycetales bacterium]
MDFTTTVIVAVLAGLGIGIHKSLSDGRSQQEVLRKIQMQKGIRYAATYATPDAGIGVSAEGRVCIAWRSAEAVACRIFSPNEIVKSEIIDDGETVSSAVRSSQLGGALIGAVLAGPAGLIVGGISGKRVTRTRCKSLSLRVTVNDMSRPTHQIAFLTQEVDRTSVLYTNANALARDWQGRFDAIIKHSAQTPAALATAG